MSYLQALRLLVGATAGATVGATVEYFVNSEATLKAEPCI